jgi:hypothetical protein
MAISERWPTSVRLSKAESNYCVTRRELLATVKTLQRFYKYLYGQEFHLCTDHSALTCLQSFSSLERQTGRWVQRQQEYKFTSEHLQGRKHQRRCTVQTVSREMLPQPGCRAKGERLEDTSSHYCRC